MVAGGLLMAVRIAGACSIAVFAMCLMVGHFTASNSFETSVARALAAMVGTLVIGLVLGKMAERMLIEATSSSAGGGKKVVQTPQPPDGP